MKTVQYRLAKRDGELIQQRRYVTSTTKNKWWKPWAYEVDYDHGEWIDFPIVVLTTFRVGDRVQVKQTAGFHKGATGVIDFIEPLGKVWVTRDGAGSPVYYHNEELELIWRNVKQEQK
jgi:hypothetical protein